MCESGRNAVHDTGDIQADSKSKAFDDKASNAVPARVCADATGRARRVPALNWRWGGPLACRRCGGGCGLQGNCLGRRAWSGSSTSLRLGDGRKGGLVKPRCRPVRPPAASPATACERTRPAHTTCELRPPVPCSSTMTPPKTDRLSAPRAARTRRRGRRRGASPRISPRRKEPLAAPSARPPRTKHGSCSAFRHHLAWKVVATAMQSQACKQTPSPDALRGPRLCHSG